MTTSHTFEAIHPQTAMGSVALRVTNLQRSRIFYTHVIGLQVLEETTTSATFGVDTPILTLHELENATPRPRRATGLYHFAILLPTRQDLAIKIRHLVDVQYPFGYADHLVSEAFYLDDPDGHGIEIYRDRPRESWQWNGTMVAMDNAQIDFDSLFKEAEGLANTADMPKGTRIGHMHLRIGNPEQAEAFYSGILGFDVTARWHGAVFVAAGGYHHHLGLNAWQSANASPAPQTSPSMESYSILVPHTDEIDRLATRLHDANVAFETVANGIELQDPWQNKIKLQVQTS